MTSIAQTPKSEPPAIQAGTTVRYVGPDVFHGKPAKVLRLYPNEPSAVVRCHIHGRRWSRAMSVPLRYLEAAVAS